MEDGVCKLKFQREKYMQKIEKAYTTLTGKNEFFLPLNVVGPLVGHITHMVRTMGRKSQTLVTT